METLVPINRNPVTCIGAKLASCIDQELMSDAYGYSIDQLMELAGFSVAEAIRISGLNHQRTVVICGPGNNGGDGNCDAFDSENHAQNFQVRAHCVLTTKGRFFLGLVAARYLKQQHNSNTVVVLYPKMSRTSTHADLYLRLVQQAKAEGISVVNSNDELPLSGTGDVSSRWAASFDLVVDAMFGFGFKGPVREPFDFLISLINDSKLPVASVDIPSGWDVATGRQKHCPSLNLPSLVVSLMLPKLCMHSFCVPDETSSDLRATGNNDESSSKDCLHFLGLPTIPRELLDKYNVALPARSAKDNPLAIRLH